MKRFGCGTGGKVLFENSQLYHRLAGNIIIRIVGFMQWTEDDLT